MQAKKKQKQLLSTRKRSILSKSGKGKTTKLGSLDQDEKDAMAENRKTKMNFEMARHHDMKKMESEKIALDKARFEMEKDNMELKKELEKSKIVLLRLEMFKKRQEIKKEYTEVTEEYLDEHFPYPK